MSSSMKGDRVVGAATGILCVRHIGWQDGLEDLPSVILGRTASSGMIAFDGRNEIDD